MKFLLSDRRLFIALIGIIGCIWRPEVAYNIMAISMTVAATNSVQAIFAKKDKESVS